MLSPKQVQTDFSAGACPAYARHLIPDNGVYALVNGLLDNDGAIYKRGGSTQISKDAATGAWGQAGLTWIWDGYFTGFGHRTLVGSVEGLAVVEEGGANAGRLNLLNYGLAGTTIPAPVSAAMLKGVLFVGGGIMYAGSAKSGIATSVETVAVTNGSANVVGAGGSLFTINAYPGNFVSFGDGRLYLVKTVTDNTHLTLSQPYAGTTGATKTMQGGIAAVNLATGTLPPVAPVYTVCGQRVIACKDNVWSFSAFDDPLTWNVNDNWELPEGVVITGAMGIDNTLTLFTTEGIWQVGNVEQDPVDFYGNPQHTSRRVTADINLWSAPGLATWAGNIIAPAVDGVWMISGNRFEKISKSIDKAYTAHVHAGRTTGQATVHAGHYLLPIVEPNGQVREVLCCRLDRPTSARGQTIYPWSSIQGVGAHVIALAVKTAQTGARDPRLLGAEQVPHTTGGRVLDLTNYFVPSDTALLDYDGSTPNLLIETRDYASGPLTDNLVKAMRLGYRLLDAASNDPILTAEYSNGQEQKVGATWGTARWGTDTWTASQDSEWRQVMDVAPEDDGRKPKFWRLRSSRARSRYIRFRLRSDNPSSECSIRSIELFTRRSGRL
jgi:hypothetical protein